MEIILESLKQALSTMLCNNVIWKKQFYELMSYEQEPVQPLEDLKNIYNINMASSIVKQQVKSKDIQQSSDKKTLIYGNFECKEEDYTIEKAVIDPVLHNGQDLNEIVHVILNTVKHISDIRYYGVTMLLDVLRGIETERLLDAKLHSVSEYGILKSISREELQAIIEWMIGDHFLLKTKGQYPVLHPTYDGIHYRDKMTTVKLNRLKKYLEEEVILWKQ